MKRLSIVCLILLSTVFFLSACIKTDAIKPLPDATQAAQTPLPAEITAQPTPTIEITPSPTPLPLVLTTPEPTPTPAPAGVTEKKLGFIAKAYSKDGTDYIEIDYVEMFFGPEAIAKALEDNSDWLEQDENGKYYIANDYYIRNNNTMLRTFPLAPDCVISIVHWEAENWDASIPMKKVSFSAFAKLVKNNSKNHYLMHVDVQNGFMVSLEEQYRP